MNARMKLRRLFREWLNNYLTVQHFADDHDMTKDYATRVIETGRILHNRRAKELSRYLFSSE